MSGDPLDLDTIEAEARRRAETLGGGTAATTLALVAEVRRLRALTPQVCIPCGGTGVLPDDSSPLNTPRTRTCPSCFGTGAT